MQAKKILMAAAILSVGIACAQETTSLVDARKQIVASISNPAVMTATVKQLSAEDQRQYLADVVAAVGKMPGSQEEKAASYLSVCRAALRGRDFMFDVVDVAGHRVFKVAPGGTGWEFFVLSAADESMTVAYHRAMRRADGAPRA